MVAKTSTTVAGQSLIYVAGGMTCRPGCTAFDFTAPGCSKLAGATENISHICCSSSLPCIEMYSVNDIHTSSDNGRCAFCMSHCCTPVDFMLNIFVLVSFSMQFQFWRPGQDACNFFAPSASCPLHFLYAWVQDVDAHRATCWVETTCIYRVQRDTKWPHCFWRIFRIRLFLQRFLAE